VQGEDSTTAERSAEVTGVLGANDEIAAEITGSARPACLPYSGRVAPYNRYPGRTC